MNVLDNTMDDASGRAEAEVDVVVGELTLGCTSVVFARTQPLTIRLLQKELSSTIALCGADEMKSGLS